MTTTAIIWELTTPTGDHHRILIAGNHILTQTTTPTNQRPRWDINHHPGNTQQHAINITHFIETEYNATLTVPPTTLTLHPTELRTLNNPTNTTIPPALRARAYTAIHRHHHTTPTAA